MVNPRVWGMSGLQKQLVLVNQGKPTGVGNVSKAQAKAWTPKVQPHKRGGMCFLVTLA
jgi:hypothetical protein